MSIIDSSGSGSFDSLESIESSGSDENRLKYFVLSVDTLCGGHIDQTIKKGWRERPPPVSKMSRFRRNEKKAEHLLKKACREGVPPALRCAVWIICTLRFSEQKESFCADQYGTLAKACALENGWEYVKRSVFPHTGDDDEAELPSFGLTAEELDYFMDCKSTREITAAKVSEKGRRSLVRVLVCIQKQFGITYAPMIPYIACLLLTHMPECYAFVTLREMVTDDYSFFPLSTVQYYQWCKTFSNTVARMFPDTYEDMRRVGALSPDGLAPIFQRFFVDLFPREYVLRLLDIFCITGAKSLFRFGISLISLSKKRLKALPISTAEDWWEETRSVTFNPSFNIDDFIKRSYGKIAGNLRKSIRFPNRRLILRLFKSNEEWARENAPVHSIKEIIHPLGLVQNLLVDKPLAKPTLIRKNLANWLPPTLRETKLDLIYSSNVHGASLENFYKHVSKTKRTVLLMEVMKTGHVIGMYASWAWQIHPHTYGDGNCFLFRASPSEKAAVFKWSPPVGKNLHDDDVEQAALWEQFMVGRRQFISAGANSNGTCGLRLNEDLSKGSSYQALGFNNEPLAGVDLKEFDVTRVEVYRFLRGLDGMPLDKVDEVWQW